MNAPPEIADLLQPDEPVVWTGHPDAGRMARAARVMVAIGILFIVTAICFFLILRAILSAWLALAGLPFALLGLLMVAAPTLARRRANRTLYVLTDRRALIRQPDWLGRVRVEEFSPRQLDEVTRVVDPDGSGHLVFFLRETALGEGMVTARKAFQAIERADEVESLVRRTLLSSGVHEAPTG